MREWSPLRKAVEQGDIDAARSLIAAGADVDEPDGHDPGPFSLLHHAIDVETDGFDQTGSTPRTEMIELLISAGADVRQANYRGETPLDMATGHPSLDAVIKRSLGVST